VSDDQSPESPLPDEPPIADQPTEALPAVDGGEGGDGGGRRLAVPAIVVGVVIIVAAIIGAFVVINDDGPPPTTTTTLPPTTTSTTEPPPPAALTGVPTEDAAIRDRAALVLKIDNHDQLARPPAGLLAADVVYEEQVEGGVTRLAAVFHSDDAERVGPVRSGRTTDIFLVSNLGRPLFGFSGANPATSAEIARADIWDVRWDNRVNLYRRDGSRPAPHNLFTDTVALRDSTPDATGPPPSLFEFIDAGTELEGDPADVIEVGFGGSGGYRSTWTLDAASGTYARDQLGRPHVDEEGEQVHVSNVVVQVVDYVTRFGNPEAQLLGSGDVWVFRDGVVTQGRWSRSNLGDRTTFTDLDGGAILLRPGKTWIALPPVGRPPVFRAAVAD